uniref:E3 ubiquitin-protein ligase Trim36-like isoform X2 n=2 Tax=Myxine glutinosa TaxID=7769 RepID=UPI00358ECDE3
MIVNQSPFPPELDTKKCSAYGGLNIHWSLPLDSGPAKSFRLEYQLIGFYEAGSSANEAVCIEELDVPKDSRVGMKENHQEWICGPLVEGSGAAVASVTAVSPASAYAVRVQAFGPAGSSDYSQELIIYTTPAEVLWFRLDDRSGYNKDSLELSEDRRTVCSQAPLGIVAQLAERPCPTGTFLPVDHIVGDFAITRGRHAWVVDVDPSSCVVRVGVVNATKLPDWFSTSRQLSSPRFEQDSGHDSGSEEVETAQPSLLITIARGRLFLPRGQTVSAAGSTNMATEALPLPRRLTVCLDHDEGWVAFYNSDGTPSCFCRRLVDCSGPVYPAFGMLGGGKLRIHPLDLG